jgi:hypothetical protein
MAPKSMRDVEQPEAVRGAIARRRCADRAALSNQTFALLHYTWRRHAGHAASQPDLSSRQIGRSVMTIERSAALSARRANNAIIKRVLMLVIISASSFV